jgi:P27 family predicted phage terminase small subunit
MTKGRKAGIVPVEGGVDTVPSPPAILDKYARKVWKAVVPDLVQRKVLTPADMPGLQNFCIACGKVERLEKAIQALGDVFDPKLESAQEKAMATARQIGDHYGLSPTSRSRPAVRDSENNDDDTPLVGGRRQRD